MYLAGPLGGPKEDAINALSAVVGRDLALRLVNQGAVYVNQIVRQGEARIRTEAEKGALVAVPRIRREVRKEVLPWVLGSAGVSLVAVILAGWALKRSR